VASQNRLLGHLCEAKQSLPDNNITPHASLHHQQQQKASSSACPLQSRPLKLASSGVSRDSNVLVLIPIQHQCLRTFAATREAGWCIILLSFLHIILAAFRE